MLGDPGLLVGTWHNLLEQLLWRPAARGGGRPGPVDHPPFPIADNPTSELDPISAERVFAALFTAVRDGAALVLVTDEAAASVACSRQVIPGGSTASRLNEIRRIPR